MNHNPIKIRSAMNYYGSKSFMARRILDLLPDHQVYVEPFAGGMNVLLNKYRSPVEVASDLDFDLIHFYTTLVDQTEELIKALGKVPYSRESFDWARDRRVEKTLLERAVSYITIQSMVWVGEVGSPWMDDTRRRGNWSRLETRLRPVAERLRGVRLIHGQAIDVIREYDGLDTAYYIDPPYYPNSRVSPKAYAVEMTAFDHLRLLKVIQDLRGSVVVSGYDSIHYQEALRGWRRVEMEVPAYSGPVQAGGKRTRRVEILWVKNSRTF